MTRMDPAHAPDADAREIVFANARIALADEIVRGSVAVRDGLIADVAQGGTAVRGAIDCAGDLLAPGLIELHTDNLERHLEPRPGVPWPHRPAAVAHDAELASVGITTVFDALRVGMIESHARSNRGRYAREMTDVFAGLKREGLLRISHFVHLRAEICSETLADELAAFGPGDDVRIVSMMDHTPGQRQFRDLTQLRVYHRDRHGRSESEFRDYVAFLHKVKARMGAGNEAAIAENAARLGATLASHDDTDAAHVAASARLGCRIAEFPTTREAAQASREAGIAVMMGAPNLMRGGSQSGNVSAAELADAGLLDILSSDYVPAALLTGALMLARRSGDLAAAVAAVTRAPARAAGLTDRGEIAPGLRADLIRVRETEGLPALRGVWVGGARI